MDLKARMITDNSEYALKSLEELIEENSLKFRPTGSEEEAVAKAAFKVVRYARKVWRDLDPEVKQAFGSEIQYCKGAFNPWFKVSKPYCPDAIEEDYYAIYLDTFRKVKFPEGADPVEVAKQRASEQPVPYPVRKLALGDSMEKLAHVCFELQKTSKTPGNFYLSCRDAGKAIGKGHETANHYLGSLVAEGVLEISRKGTPGVKHGKATEFHWLLKED